MYYPGSALISPTKQTQNAFIGRIPLKKGCTFEEKANTFEKEEEEEYGLKLSKMNEEEINNKVERMFLVHQLLMQRSHQPLVEYLTNLEL